MSPTNRNKRHLKKAIRLNLFLALIMLIVTYIIVRDIWTAVLLGFVFWLLSLAATVQYYGWLKRNEE